MMNKIAKNRRKAGEENVYGPDELVPWRERFSAKEILLTWIRPFRMFLTEPIVLTLSLLSGFRYVWSGALFDHELIFHHSDALIFMFIQSFSIVYKQWGFSASQIGLAFIPIGIGYVLAWLIFIPAIQKNVRERRDNPDDERAQYESRLWFLLWTAPCLPIGLIGFAWTSGGPPIHWVGSMVFAAIVGIANYAIYMATIDYMVCAYGPYSASATGGNGWSRDFLAGVLTIPATPFFQNIGPPNRHLQYASTILFCIAFLLVLAVYVIYWKGPILRKRSPFAQHLALQRVEGDASKSTREGAAHEAAVAMALGTADGEKRANQDPEAQRPSRIPLGSRRSSQQRAQQEARVRSAHNSRANSRANSRVNSRIGTPTASRRQSLDAPINNV